MHLFIYVSCYHENLSMNYKYATLIISLCVQSPTTFMSVHQQRHTMPLHLLQTSFCVCFSFYFLFVCFFVFIFLSLMWPRATLKSRSAGVCFLGSQKDKAGLHNCTPWTASQRPRRHGLKPHGAAALACDGRQTVEFPLFWCSKAMGCDEEVLHFHLQLVKFNKTTQ